MGLFGHSRGAEGVRAALELYRNDSLVAPITWTDVIGEEVCSASTFCDQLQSDASSLGRHLPVIRPPSTAIIRPPSACPLTVAAVRGQPWLGAAVSLFGSTWRHADTHDMREAVGKRLAMCCVAPARGVGGAGWCRPRGAAAAVSP